MKPGNTHNPPFAQAVTLLGTSLQPVFNNVEALYTKSVMLAGNVGDGPNDYDPSSPDGTQLVGTSAVDFGGSSVTPLVWSNYVSGTGGIAWRSRGGRGGDGRQGLAKTPG